MTDKEREDSCVELCDSWCEQAELPTYTELQSQLAAANERADGLQTIVEAARAQKPVAYVHNKRVDVIHASVKSLLSDFAVNSGPESMLRPIDKSENYTIPLYAAAPVPSQPAVVPEGLANAVLANIAAIAHCGGLAKLDNENALSNIRQLSKPWCDNTGTLRDLKNRVDAAILSTTDTEVKR